MTNVNPLYNTQPPYTPHFDQNQAPNPLDTSLAFQNISNLTANSLDYGQYQTSQLPRRLNDGNARHQSPGFQHPAYQVNPVIPAKRARPGEDHVSASPQPTPGMLGASRAQTPQQPLSQQFQNPFNNIHGAQGFQTPNPYQNAQNGSAHGSPSPAMTGQHGIPSQRPPSATPHPFAGNMQNFGNFPVPQNNMNRMNTPQSQVNQQFMRNMQMNQAFNQRAMGTPQPMMQGSIPGSMSGTQSGMPAPSTPQFPQDAQQQYKMRLQQAQESMLGNMGQNRTQTPSLGPGSPAPAQNGQSMGRSAMPQHQQQDQQSQQPQQSSAQHFVQNQNQIQNQAQVQAMAQSQAAAGSNSQEKSFFQRLQNFAQQHGQQLTPDPRVCGRPVNLFLIFQAVHKLGLMSQNLAQQNWGQLAHMIGFPEQQYPTAGAEVRQLFNTDLQAFVRVWYITMQKRRMQFQQQQGQGQGQMGSLQSSPQQANQALGPQSQGINLSAAQTYQLQLQQQQQQQQAQVQQSQQPPQPSQALNMPEQIQHQQFQQNQGMPTPQHQQSQQTQPPPSFQQSHGTPLQRNQPTPSVKRSPSVVQNEASKVSQSPSVSQDRKPRPPPPDFKRSKTSGTTVQTPPVALEERVTNMTPNQDVTVPDQVVAVAAPPPPEVSKEYIPHVRNLESYGGIPLAQVVALGEELSKVRPGVPLFDEMGAVDMHALCMSIQSGMHGELRYALDQLVSLSSDARCLQLSLVDCGDLMDSLIECAEDQLELLAEGSAIISDEAELPNFEELSRAARDENDGLQEDPEFASSEYEMKQAVDRILAVTTILRNISFADSALNHDMLASGPLLPFLATTIKLIGTRESFFLNARNSVDFYKDCVILLSNICHRVELPSKDDALAILQILVAFAPSAPVSEFSSSPDRVTFALYDPKLHHYLPSALDALTKLLARDEPNRAYYKSIFAADYNNSLRSGSPPSTLLLTRAFSLAIAPIPDRSKGILPTGLYVRIAEARKPFLSQGMLAADILSTLCPAPAEPFTTSAITSTTAPTASTSAPTTDAVPSTSDTPIQPPLQPLKPNPLARLWLESEDAWSKSLMQLILQLAGEAQPSITQRRDPATGRNFMVQDPLAGFGIVVQRGAAMLCRLAEKCGVVTRSGVTPDASVRDAGVQNADGEVDGQATGDVDTTDDAVVIGLNYEIENQEVINTSTNTNTATKQPDTTIDASIGIGQPFSDVVPGAEELLAALSNPTFEAVTLRSLVALARWAGSV